MGAFTRSMLSSLIPSNRQSRLFSFYELSQDSTSWIGPLIISSLAVIYRGNEEYRLIVVLVGVVQFAVGWPILLAVNVPRGISARMECDKNGYGSEWNSINNNITIITTSDLPHNNNVEDPHLITNVIDANNADNVLEGGGVRSRSNSKEMHISNGKERVDSVVWYSKKKGSRTSTGVVTELEVQLL